MGNFGSSVKNNKESTLPTIQLSGNEERVGTIISCNASLCKLFGYAKERLIGSNISMLMPGVLAKHHNGCMILSAAREADNNSPIEISIVGLHRNGYVFPAWLKVTTYPDLADGYNVYLGTIEPERSHMSTSTTYLLVDQKQTVVNMSSNALNTLRLSNEVLNQSRVYVPNLVPEAFTEGDRLDEGLYREGKRVKYYLPDFDQMRSRMSRMSMLDTTPLATADKFGSERGKGEALHRSDQCVEVHCKAVEMNMKGVGRVATLLCLQDPQNGHYAKKEADLKPAPTKQKAVFVYDSLCNKFRQDFAGNKGVSEDSGKFRQSTMRVPLKDEVVSTFADPGANVGQLRKLRNSSIYSAMLSACKMDKGPNEQYGNVYDLLASKCENFYGEGVVVYRIAAGGQFDKVDEKDVRHNLQITHDLDGDTPQKRKLANEPALLGKLEIDNKKSLEAAMQKFLNLRMISLSAVGIGLTIIAIIICTVLEFVYFDKQYSELSDQVGVCKYQSRVLPNILYGFSHIQDLSICLEYGYNPGQTRNESLGYPVINLCTESTYNPSLASKQKELTQFYEELDYIDKQYGFPDSDDGTIITLVYPKYSRNVSFPLKDAVRQAFSR